MKSKKHTDSSFYWRELLVKKKHTGPLKTDMRKVMYGMLVSCLVVSCQNELYFYDSDRNPVISTRALIDGTEPIANGIFVDSPIVNLQAGVESSIKGSFTGVGHVLVNIENVLPEYNLSISPVTVLTTPFEISVKWTAAGAPATGFTVPVRLIPTGVGDDVVVYLVYDPTATPVNPMGKISITPAGIIPDGGGIYSCTFDGATYTGDVYFRAKKGSDIYVGDRGTVTSSLTVAIPEATDDSNVIFQYSLNNVEWVDIESRTQLYETLGVGVLLLENSKGGDIPVGGTKVTQKFNGTFSSSIMVQARVNDKVIATGTGNVVNSVELQIPANDTGASRTIAFGYSKNGGKTWKGLTFIKQLGN